MWFVVPDPGLTDQSSWEARLGALGRCAEAGGDTGWGQLFEQCGDQQRRGSGSP